MTRIARIPVGSTRSVSLNSERVMRRVQPTAAPASGFSGRVLGGLGHLVSDRSQIAEAFERIPGRGPRHGAALVSDEMTVVGCPVAAGFRIPFAVGASAANSGSGGSHRHYREVARQPPCISYSRRVVRLG